MKGNLKVKRIILEIVLKAQDDYFCDREYDDF